MSEAKMPREAVGRAAVGRVFRAELRDLDDLLRLAFAIVGRGSITIGNKRGLNPPVVRVVLALYVKACKTARAIRLVAAAGLPEDALILTRSLFETSLALFFILQRTPRVRAQMYLAYSSVQTKKALIAWKQTAGLKRKATKKLMAEVDQQIQDSTAILGQAVVDSLRRGYSGMTVEATAARLGWANTYHVFYRYASSFSHASDPAQHLGFAPDGTPILKLTPGADPVIDTALAMARGILWTILYRVDARLGLCHASLIEPLRPKP
jgi:hypothetical protein